MWYALQKPSVTENLFKVIKKERNLNIVVKQNLHKLVILEKNAIALE